MKTSPLRPIRTRRSVQDQREASLSAAVLVDEAVALVSTVPAAAALLARTTGRERTVGPLQDRLVEAIRLTRHREADRLWKRASAIWWSLAEEHRAFVEQETRRACRLHPQCDAEDLLTEAMIGAWEGCRRFDVRHPVTLPTYLSWWVGAALRNATRLDRTITVPADVILAQAQLANHGHRTPRGTPRRLAAADRVAHVVSLEDAVAPPDESPSPEEHADRVRRLDRLAVEVGETGRRVLTARLQGRTHVEAGAEAGVSRREASAIERAVRATIGDE